MSRIPRFAAPRGRRSASSSFGFGPFGKERNKGKREYPFDRMGSLLSFLAHSLASIDRSAAENRAIHKHTHTIMEPPGGLPLWRFFDSAVPSAVRGSSLARRKVKLV